MVTAKQLERKINRRKEKLKQLEDNKENLSKHGYFNMGLLKGEIYVLEDWLDEINESEGE